MISNFEKKYRRYTRKSWRLVAVIMTVIYILMASASLMMEISSGSLSRDSLLTILLLFISVCFLHFVFKKKNNSNKYALAAALIFIALLIVSICI